MLFRTEDCKSLIDSLVTCNKGFIVGTNDDKSMKSYALKSDDKRCGYLRFDDYDEYCLLCETLKVRRWRCFQIIHNQVTCFSQIIIIIPRVFTYPFM